ncbi:hypothetical protein BpHYR1_007413 [Brachionus plicatilis]|uniref:Uncharacterized protein n=1 Tax=Brachionus plicatilis TaxID=10195 RepID=A0A3M7QUF8_BRAPC|nr:hypothetical protein BpHYR1_007413 [Brachionus plicatilis]
MKIITNNSIYVLVQSVYFIIMSKFESISLCSIHALLRPIDILKLITLKNKITKCINSFLNLRIGIFFQLGPILNATRHPDKAFGTAGSWSSFDICHIFHEKEKN